MSENNEKIAIHIDRIGKELDGLSCDSPAIFVSYMLLSARLAAMGDQSRFLEWPRIATNTGVDVLAALGEAFGHAEPLLEAGDGDAICQAEDVNCLRRIEPSSTGLLGAIDGVLDCWVQSALEAIPAAESLDILHARRESVPLGPEYRLPLISEPLIEEELLLCAGLPRPDPQRIGQRVRAEMPAEEEMALLDGGHPSERMISRFQSRSGELAVAGSGKVLKAVAQLDHWWGVQVFLDGEGAEDADAVRLGTLTLQRHPEDPSVFQGSLGRVDLANRLRLLGLDVCIAMRDGGRVLL